MNDGPYLTDVPAVYFVQPSSANVKRIASDLGGALYEVYHLNFSSSLPRALLEVGPYPTKYLEDTQASAYNILR
jgi:hypothetical protein